MFDHVHKPFTCDIGQEDFPPIPGLTNDRYRQDSNHHTRDADCLERQSPSLPFILENRRYPRRNGFSDVNAYVEHRLGD